MRKMLPLNSLRAFEATARHLSFNAAANELGVTPTAVSHQIRQLEDMIGEQLFRRRPRPIKLTAAGSRLFPGLRESFDGIERSLRDLSKTRRKEVLRVTNTVSFASGFWLSSLDDWARENDDIELEIHGSDHLVDLKGDDAHVAIRYAKDPCESLCWEPLCADSYWVMGAPQIFEGRENLTPEEVLASQMISYRWKVPDPYEPTWEKWCAAARSEFKCAPDLARSRMLRLSEESNALEAALAGKGLVLGSEVITRAARRAGRLKILSPVKLRGLSYWLVYPPSAQGDHRLPRLKLWLKHTLEKGATRTPELLS